MGMMNNGMMVPNLDMHMRDEEVKADPRVGGGGAFNNSGN